jgi:rubrerythrin
MTIGTTHHYRSSTEMKSPVEDQVYDLLQVLTSKCEAIEAYAKYEEDADTETRQLFQELARDDARHAEKLLQALRGKIGQN